MDACDAAQAVELVGALREKLHQMTHQLGRLEHKNLTGMNSRASTMRCEAAALQRDINEARILIDRLQRRYLNSDGARPGGTPAVPRVARESSATVRHRRLAAILSPVPPSTP
jgi:hypothetical protein